MKLYQKIRIDDFETKRNELIAFVRGKFNDPNELTYYDPTFEEISSSCPNLYSYLIKKSKINIRLFRIYHSPAGSGLGKHIDGISMIRSPIGLNIPILNCKGSLMKWWDETDAKIITGNFGYNNLSACKIENPEDLKCIGQTEIDEPSFVRTDVIHSVENYNKEPRIILSVRWRFDLIEGQQFEQVMDYEPYEN